MLPGQLADRFGVLNGKFSKVLSHITIIDRIETVILPYTITGGALIFAMFGASSTGGLVAFAIVYGPCGGACECHYHLGLLGRYSEIY